MTCGIVNTAREPVVSLRFRGPGVAVVTVPILVDTGYSGVITLPARTIAVLGLTGHLGGSIVMADGSVRQCGRYQAELERGGGWRTVLVTEFGASEAILGLEMLDGHTLRIDATPGGIVYITPHP